MTTAAPPRHKRVWRPEEIARAVELVEGHGHLGRSAARLGRTRGALTRKVKEEGIVPSAANDARSVQGVADLFGVHPRTVVRWVEGGLLRARSIGEGNHRRLVAWDDLDAFLRDAAGWPFWDPAQIRDAAIRDAAAEIRHGVCFYSTAEAGRLLGMARAQVGQRCRDGRLRSVVTHSAYRIRGDWLDAYRAVLAQEVRIPLRGRRLTAEENAFLREWRPHQPLYALADALEISATGARLACERLGVAGPPTPHLPWRTWLTARAEATTMNKEPPQ